MNLITEPWISVTSRSGHSLVSLDTLFAHATDIGDMVAKPHERIALSMKLVIFLWALPIAVLAQPTNAPKRIPPPGILIPASARSELESGLRRLQNELASVRAKLPSDNERLLLPDAEIYEKAVRYALQHNEFYRTNEIKIAGQLLDEGLRRMQAIGTRTASWPSATGLVVRGYQSRIDGSAQPYGLIIPASYRPSDGKRYRLDIWLHGRDETLTELKFINDRSTKMGEFAPTDTFVLHPYGRYCNAFKFAGETDVLEALEAVEHAYPIDTSRVALRGFSMGGAGAWHLAAHFADRWVCASPGAGFAETAQYLRLNPASVPAHERALWQWYDATDYALNLFNCPVVAYSGELDKQRQAAEIMEQAMQKEGLPLIHLIGPKTEHRYEPETKRVVAATVDTFARIGRPEIPKAIRFSTRTLRYPRMHWLALLGLEKHWERADAWATLDPDRVRVSLTNVSSFALLLPSEQSRTIREVEVNGSRIRVPPGLPAFVKRNGVWTSGALPAGKVKRPGLQGPIDDAFTGSFIFVAPSRPGFHKETDAWVEKEFKRAVYEWRAQFRGDARVVNDTEVSESQIKTSNLILWGDPQSNELLGKLLSQLPIQWTSERIEMAKVSRDPAHHLPLLIYPNPLNPEKYIVLNSGFTFRGFGSNADQTPKLPDYALLAISQPDPFHAGVVSAGFFNEQWGFE